jgi:hypothetical protein
MPELSHIDPGSAALLVMDYQVDSPRLLRRPRCRGACDAARHRYRVAGGRRHHGGARRCPAWNLIVVSHQLKP